VLHEKWIPLSNTCIFTTPPTLKFWVVSWSVGHKSLSQASKGQIKHSYQKQQQKIILHFKFFVVVVFNSDTGFLCFGRVGSSLFLCLEIMPAIFVLSKHV
jgi:hypothetical protein